LHSDVQPFRDLVKAVAALFDVIIYDALESPVLWIEDNPDNSSGGRSLAIPVEHVKAAPEATSHFLSRR
jgi:hypothetical protein